MTNFTVLYDANVLYSAPLRDLLVELALTDLFGVRWTEEIHSEWVRNVLQNRSELTIEQLTRTKNLMNANVKDCLVTGYEELIPYLQLPDLDDRHVLAAAIRSQAKYIITFNLRDFPNEAIAPYNIQAKHPDDFILDLLSLNYKAVCQAAERQRNRLKNPPKTPDEYLATLVNQGLVQSVARMRELCW
ncbi:PIN domain-containing protein [Planktothrix sp. FACHB-1355]|uniref:PIN domain-containing protein n=1 Tax=Aerosakkonema funiforme FACHB-1375 TaxID=2949571 RepID=A0A926ZED5_9CYAN|nr:MULTISPECIES: PIN domain-containing protein [Oscillatoriales]MBD2179948.1 PIN domain-containing protein [Aerosakkonema funiforme FACHB-1375]MBD3559550.1 PIN domain-containing protein [Planktothrix sp. FACHB-1355]